jgi:glycosyltransferase involved in cell wall biosynthesis
MFFLCTKNKYDAIYVREMEKNPGPRWCSKFFHIPLYKEINDLIVLVLSESGFPPKIVRKVGQNQALDFQHATGLIVPSVPMCDWITNQYELSQSKVHMILNGTDMSNINELSKIEAKEELKVPPVSFCLGYLGNIYKEYDFDSILQAFIRCQDKIPHLYLILIGNGPIADELKETVRELGLEKKTIFTGYVHPENLGRILPALDIGLLIRSKEGTLRYGPVSTKLSTYALFHLPVITAGLSLEGYPNELNQSLHLVPPKNPNFLADMILWLFNHPEESKYKADLLYDFVIKNLTWDSVTREILDIIKKDNLIR